MRLDRLDRRLGPLLTLFALAWLWLVFHYVPGARAEGEPGPRAFPVLLGAVLVGLGLAMTLTALTPGRRDDAAPTIPPMTPREIFFALGTCGLLVLYAFLLDAVGFVVGTPIVMVLAMGGLLRMRHWVRVMSLAAGFTFVCWVIFVVVLGTPLPRGTWMPWL